MPPKKLTPNGKAAEPAGKRATSVAKKAAPKSTKTASKRSAPSTTKKYIRNVRGVNIRVTFDTGRKVTLNPRGQRGDMTVVSKEEMEDPIFLNNLGNLYEVISAKEADEIREKQSTNSSTHPSPRPEDILTDELGNQGNFTGLEPSNTEISKTIGHLTETEGRPNEEKATQITRGVNPERANVPGSSLDQYGTPISIAPLPPISERE